jgi:ABC-type sulfate transport system permease subunit
MHAHSYCHLLYEKTQIYTSTFSSIQCSHWQYYEITHIPLHHVGLLCVKLLLCNNRKMGNYTRVVSGQWLVEHVPVAR